MDALVATQAATPDRIHSIDVSMIQVPLPRDFRGSTYSVTHKNAVLTRIQAESGAVGEAVNGEGDAAIHAATVKFARDTLCPALVGADAGSIAGCWEQMVRLRDRVTATRVPATRAMAAVDCALWDLLGSKTGTSLHRLWGGHRSALPIIAIGGQYHDGYAPEDYGREMEELRALGLAGCKFKVGGLSPEEDAARTRAARRAGGDDFILCVDANRGWKLADALDYARRVADLGVRWFEEPCIWSNERMDMARVRAVTGLPVTAGQSEISAEGCRDLVTADAIDVCNIDASWGGGASVWLRIAAMAQCFGVEMAHHGEPVIGAQLLAAVSNGTYVETHHPERDPLFHRMAVGRGAIRDGVYELPTGPGWGISLDPDMVARFRVK